MHLSLQKREREGERERRILTIDSWCMKPWSTHHHQFIISQGTVSQPICVNQYLKQWADSCLLLGRWWHEPSRGDPKPPAKERERIRKMQILTRISQQQQHASLWWMARLHWLSISSFSWRQSQLKPSANQSVCVCLFVLKRQFITQWTRSQAGRETPHCIHHYYHIIIIKKNLIIITLSLNGGWRNKEMQISHSHTFTQTHGHLMEGVTHSLASTLSIPCH